MTYEIFHWTNLTLGFFYSIEILLIALNVISRGC